MSDRLPPLTALRAFEAAARHMSFAKAADELNVTPAALSFQIKSLEEHLGEPVFRRLNRAVELTEAGRTLAPGCSNAFNLLSEAWSRTLRLQDAQALNVTAGPAFTAKWLAPRIYDFAQAHPEIELRFSAALRRMDLRRENIDVAIRYGYGPDTGLYSEPLHSEWVCPVMTPALAKEFPTIESLAADAPLIFDESIDFLKTPAGWPEWFATMNVDFTPRQGPHFSQADHAIDAALSGVGVVMGRRALVVKDIADGRLVMPFPIALNTGARFRFICAKGDETRPHIKAFRDYIWAEAGKTTWVSDGVTIVEPAASA
ncbi:MAG: transcriptional regulator GcvA [Aliishimia sp.]